MIYSINGQKFDSDFLEHFGIKGMKWGVRRYQNPDGTWTEEGLKRRRQDDFARYYKKQYRDSFGDGAGYVRTAQSMAEIGVDKDDKIRKEFRSAVKKLGKLSQDVSDRNKEASAAMAAAENAFMQITTKKERDELFDEASDKVISFNTDYDTDQPHVDRDGVAMDVWFASGRAPDAVYSTRAKADAARSRYNEELQDTVLDLVGPDHYNEKVLPFMKRLLGREDSSIYESIRHVIGAAIDEAESQKRWREDFDARWKKESQAREKRIKDYEKEFIKSKRG